MQPKGPKQSNKTHRRSRTGCFTCRLRRKKCDEGKPKCRACKHLGLICDYKRPCWWGNAEQRKNQKENIKMMIKRTKLTEKAVHLSSSPSRSPPPGLLGGASLIDSPPALSHSVPTSDTYSDTHSRTMRSLSVESAFSLEGGEPPVGIVGEGFPHPQYFPQQQQPYSTSPFMSQQQFAPGSYEVHAQKETAASFFSTPAAAAAAHHHPHQQQPQQQQQHHHHHQQQHHLPRRPSSTSSFGSGLRRSSFPGPDPAVYHHPNHQHQHQHQHQEQQQQQQQPHSPEPTPYIPVEDSDRRLMEHFLDTVQHLFFPILSLHGTARQSVILPALEHNESYRHCCLSIAALHLKTTQQLDGPQAEYVDQDITRHRYATISGLCEALARDTDHLQILEATLGMILFQCSVGTPLDSLPDIPWHHHFQAAVSLVQKLDLSRYLQPSTAQPSLNMTLAAWIDILGATMLGQAPRFADTYREKHLSSSHSGLRELMGCDDSIMYLISEIACLEALRDQNMLDQFDLCEHVKSLAMQIDMTEPTPDTIIPPIYQSGSLDPRALTITMTSAFRYAARIYLCSLVPGFQPSQPQVVQLLAKLVQCLKSIPAEWDRALVWVYLIGGSVASPDSEFRDFFRGRGTGRGETGNWGRLGAVLEEYWACTPESSMGVGMAGWRSVMRERGWEFLLI